MENKKSNFSNRDGILGAICVVGAIVGISIIASALRSPDEGSTDNQPVATSTVDMTENSNTQNTTVSSRNTANTDNPSFKKITIKNLVSFNLENTGNATMPFIEYQGTVIQEKNIDEDNLYEIEDNGYTALLLVDPSKDVGVSDKLANGNTVIIRAINANAQDCSTTNELCTAFNLSENGLPLTLPISDPRLGNKPAIEIIHSSSQAQTTPAPQVPQVHNWTTYSDWSFGNIPASFTKNPPYYIGTNVKITGAVSDFFAKGDRGGKTNYIEIIPMTNQIDTLPSMMLQIDSSDNYQQAISVLNKISPIVAYGTVVASSPFTTTSGGTLDIPTIKVVRLDTCSGTGSSLGCLASSTTQTIFSN